MEKIYIIIFISFLYSCNLNHIENEDTLSASDIKYIKSLNLLDGDEKICKFYSEYKKQVAGNFFSNKRIATYWVDTKNNKKNEISFAFYPDIKSIDIVYNPEISYSPYLLVTRQDNTQFKVSVNGSHNEIQSFFEDVMKQWKGHENK